MNGEMEHALIVLLTGGLILATILIKWGLKKTAVPPLVGYLLIGAVLRFTASGNGLLSDTTEGFLNALANIGVVVLLFRVGLDSNLQSLLGQFRKAWSIWLGNVLLSGILGYCTASWLLGWPLVTSLYTAVALTATSLAVPVAVWRDVDALDSPGGALLLDVAELDDLSAVLLMSLLFAVTPVLKQQNVAELVPTLLQTGIWLLVKLLLFGGLCYLFSHMAERPMTEFFIRIEPMPDPMLLLVATGFVFAAVAGLLGFSLAMGAFFAGLIFSRDPDAVRLERPFIVIHDLFSPFFFISVGMNIAPDAVTVAVVPGLFLLVAAVAGKFFGTITPAVPAIGRSEALLLSVSMIPRAEIAMIVMRHGRQFGSSAVSQEAFAAMVLVTAATCAASPLVLRRLLVRLRQKDVPVDTPSQPTASD